MVPRLTTTLLHLCQTSTTTTTTTRAIHHLHLHHHQRATPHLAPPTRSVSTCSVPISCFGSQPRPRSRLHTPRQTYLGQSGVPALVVPRLRPLSLEPSCPETALLTACATLSVAPRLRNQEPGICRALPVLDIRVPPPSALAALYALLARFATRTTADPGQSLRLSRSFTEKRASRSYHLASDLAQVSFPEPRALHRFLHARATRKIHFGRHR